MNYSQGSSLSTDISLLKDITPTNFIYPTRYPCLICYERCMQPIRCIRCKQTICHKHVEKIKNKCPLCRLTPFKYQKDEFLKALTQNQLKKQRDILISKATFTCLVEGCNFEGKYHKMDLHRRKNHRNQELKDIIFPEQREKKRKKQLIQKFFLKILIRKQQEFRLSKQAKQMYDSSSKKVGVNNIFKLLWHISQCNDSKCKRLYIQQSMCFIGDENKNISQCQFAKAQLLFFDD